MKVENLKREMDLLIKMGKKDSEVKVYIDDKLYRVTMVNNYAREVVLYATQEALSHDEVDYRQ